jgi:hypothetical protein
VNSQGPTIFKSSRRPMDGMASSAPRCVVKAESDPPPHPRPASPRSTGALRGTAGLFVLKYGWSFTLDADVACQGSPR